MPFMRHHLYVFDNREMLSLYIMRAVMGFGEGLMSIFVPIYFWNLGFPFWKILYFYFLISLFFVVVSFICVPLVRRLSDKMMMLSSTPFLVIYYVGLGMLPDREILFFVLPAVAALAAFLFNVGYHIDFSGSADDGRIGRELGMVSMVSAGTQFAAPAIGGFLIFFLGFANNFLIGSTFLVVAMIPALFFPGRYVSAEHMHVGMLRKFLFTKKLMPFTFSGIGYAVETSVGRVVWPLFIFLVVGGIEQFGGVISFGLLAGAAMTYVVGALSDHGRRRRVLRWSTGVYAALWALRPFFIQPALVAANHVGSNAVGASLMTAWSTQYYKIARALPSPALFILSREVLYNITRVVALPVLMYISYSFSQGAFFTTSFFIAAFASIFFILANRVHTSTL